MTSSDLFKKLSYGLCVDESLISADFPLLDKMEKTELYNELAYICVYKSFVHPDWSVLSGRIAMRSLYEVTPEKFSDLGCFCPENFNKEYLAFILKYGKELDEMIVQERDDSFDFMGINTLKKSYLMGKKCYDGQIRTCERPQYLYLRVAAHMWMPDLDKIKKCYDSLSLAYYTHASPTLYNAGLVKPACSSCFLLEMGDSLKDITKKWAEFAFISANSGGIGCSVGNIRHSTIGSVGKSSGVVPLLKVPDAILNYVDQAGRRKGSGTFFLTCWHIDIFDFIEARKPGGEELMRARHLFYALWASDLFMERVKSDKDWSLFCPKEAPGLNEVYGETFGRLYEKYEKEGRAKKVVKAQDLWHHLMVAQAEVGMPFIVYKDACCRKNNQKHAGIPHSLNLCLEITENTSVDEVASCNLASVCLDSFIDKETKTYNFSKLGEKTREIVRNLNQVIDRNYYPGEVPSIKTTNLKHRPLGIGVQGLADVFALLDICWEDQEAKELNIKIFETMYYHAMSESMLISKERMEEGEKTPWYESFPGSDISRGFFSRDVWDAESIHKEKNIPFESVTLEQIKEYRKSKGIPESYCGYDIEELREFVQKYGTYNSLLIALMPTASTAQILKRNECFEPYCSIVGKRTVLSGTFIMVNRHFVRDMKKLGVWNKRNRNLCLNGQGSIQKIVCDTPDQQERLERIKKKYLTSFEIPQKRLAELNLDRSRYVDQSSSFNCFMRNPTYSKLSSFHFYQWSGGAKTGMYYLRSSPPEDAINISADVEKECVMCSS